MAKLSLTRRKLIEMLTENTGIAMGDSGGAYGRHWQMNQARQFENEPASVLSPVAEYVKDGSEYEPEVCHNVYHWLADRVIYDAAMQRRFSAFLKKEDLYADLTGMESFTEWLNHTGERVGGLYGEGKPMTINTYNGDSLLSQVLQFHYFTLDSDPYILLQIHGGCDVRGGYTAAKAFRLPEHDELRIFDNACAYIWTESDDTTDNWSTDDAYNWYQDGGTDGLSLKSCLITRDESERGKGKVWVSADGTPHSPLTGYPLKVAS